MANTKIKATAQLFLDISNAKDDAKQFIGDLKKQLASIETAADKMTVFKDLVSYIAMADRALAALRDKNEGAFKHMFDGMDTDFRKQFESLFGVSGDGLSKLDVLREKLQTLTPKSGIAELRKFAESINTIFSEMNVAAPFDIESEFKGKATQAHIDKLTTALSNFATVWDGLRNKIKDGFTFGGLGGDGSGAGSGGGAKGDGGLSDFNEKVQKQIDELNAKIKELEETKRKFQEVSKIASESQANGSKTIPDSYKPELTIDAVKQLADEFDVLKAKMESGDKTTADYYNNLVRMTEVVFALEKAFDGVRADDSLKQMFMSESGAPYGNMFGKLSQYASIESNKLFKQIADLNNGGGIDDIINSLLSRIETIKTSAAQSAVEQPIIEINVEKVKKQIDDLEAQIKRLDEIKELFTTVSYEKEELDLGNGLQDFATDGSVETVKQLITSYRELSQAHKNFVAANDTSSDDYYKNFAELSKVVLQLTDLESTVDEKLLEKTKFGRSNLLSALNSVMEKEGDFFEDAFVSASEAIDRTIDESKDKLQSLQKSIDEVKQQSYTATGATAVQTSKSGGVTGTSGGNGTGEVTNIDFTSLENTIKTEISQLAHKLDDVLKVEVVKSDVTAVQDSISNIESAVSDILGNIQKYKEDDMDAETSAMKNNLLQLLKTVSDFNARRVSGAYQQQELGAAILSDGTISVEHGEKGKVPWDRIASSLVGNLTKSLLVDVHSHPLKTFESGETYANDHFSGSYGDLGAFGFSKQIGAQMAAMITGNIMRVLDISKLTNAQMDRFKKELAVIQKEYSQKPEYAKYMKYDEDKNKLVYKSPKTLEDRHKTTEAFESLMYEAFSRIGFSRDDVDESIFKKYNLTDDAQLTELAERLVYLSHSVQDTLSPVERLSQIISSFGGDVSSQNARTAFEAFNKGELTAADVFNSLSGKDYKINQDTINSLMKIDTASEMSNVESLLTKIVSTLDAINSVVSSIHNRTQQDIGDKFDSAANDVLDLKYNEKIPDRLMSGKKSEFDPLNVSEFKAVELSQKAAKVSSSFISLFKGWQDTDSLDVANVNVLLEGFVETLRAIDDAQKQVKLYEQRTGKRATGTNGKGETFNLDEKLNNAYDAVTQHTVLDKMVGILSSAKSSYNKDKNQHGAVDDSSTGADSSKNETASLNDLLGLIEKVKLAIGEKDAAFQRSGSVVEQVVAQEMETLTRLKASIDEIKNDLLTISATNIDFTNIPPSTGDKDSALATSPAAPDEPKIAAGGTPPPAGPEAAELNMLQEAVENVKRAVNDKTDAFREEGQVVDQVVGSEIDALIMLEEAIDSARKAVSKKTSAFKKEDGVVSNAVLQEIDALLMLEEAVNSVKNAVTDKTDAFKQEGSVVDQVSKQEDTSEKKQKGSTGTDGSKRRKKSDGAADTRREEQAHHDNADAIREETDAQKEANNVKKTGFEIVKGWWKGLSNQSDEAVEGNSKNLINGILDKTFSPDPSLRKLMFAKFGNGRGDPNSVDSYTEQYKMFDSVLQLIGYHLGELKPSFIDENTQWGFSAEIVANSEKVVSNMEEARRILYGISDTPVVDGADKSDTPSGGDASGDTDIKNIEKRKALLSGMLNSIKAQFKSTKIDMNLDGLTQPQQDIADGYVDIIANLKQLQKTSDTVTDSQIQDAQQLYQALMKQIAAYKQQNNLAGGGNGAKKTNKYDDAVATAQGKYNNVEQIVKPYTDANSPVVNMKLEEYKASLQELIRLQAIVNGTNPSEADKDAFNLAKKACDQYHDSLLKIVKDSENLSNTSKKMATIAPGTDVMSDTGRQQALENFVNSVYGAQAVVNGFNGDYTKLNFTLKNGDGTITKMSAAFNAARTAIAATSQGTRQATSAFDSFFGQIKTKFAELWRYAAARMGVDEIIQQVRKGIEYVREIDSALTELKKVTDATDASYDNFLQSMSKTASVVGSTVSDLTTMAAEWARLGYSMDESAKLAESTAVLLNVSEFDDATTASEALISTMQAFQYTADESGHVVDILNEVGNNYAISSDGIATALQDSASALMEGGNNLEQATALVAAANRVVQDPNSVGSALRTISLRLRGTSVEVLEEMGEETEGVVESTSKLQEKIQALSGVNILTDAGDYKDTYTILKEIGNVWEDMSDIDQAALLELMAGKNRANTLSAILSNMEDLEGAYESAMQAEGSALKENETYLDSIQGKIDLFTNELQTFWMNTVSSDMVKGIVSLGTSILELVNKIGLIPTVLSGVVVYFTAIKKNNPVTVFKDLLTTMQQYNSAVQQIGALNAMVKPNGMSIDQFNAGPVNAYASAVSNLTAKQQAATLAASGLNAEQIKSVLAVNGCDEANIKLAMSEAAVAQATGQATTATGVQIVASAAQEKIKLSQNATNFLLAYSTEEVTEELLDEAVAAGLLSAEDKKLILASMGVVAANNSQAFSWKALGVAIKSAFMSNPVGMILTLATTIASIAIPVFNHFYESADELSDKVQELTNTYKEAKKEFSENIEVITVSEDTSTYATLLDEFKELTNGVNKYGENISLTADQYDRYKEICEAIVGINPSIMEGYDSATSAIGRNASALEQLIERQKEQARLNAAEYVSYGLYSHNGNFEDMADNAINAYEKAEASVRNYLSGGNGIGISNILYEAFHWNEREDIDVQKYGDATSSGDDLAKKILETIGYDPTEVAEILGKYYNEYGYFQGGSWASDYAAEIAESKQKIVDALEDDKLQEGERAPGLIQWLEKEGKNREEYNKEIDASIDAIEEWADGYKVATNNLEAAQDNMIDAFLQVPYALEEYDSFSDSTKSFITEWIKNSEIFKIDENTTQEDILAAKQTIINTIRAIANGDYTVETSSGSVISAQLILDQMFDIDPSSVDLSTYREQIMDLLYLLWEAIGGADNTFGYGNVFDMATAFGFNLVVPDELNVEMAEFKERVAVLTGKSVEEVQAWLDSLPPAQVERIMQVDLSAEQAGSHNFDSLEAMIASAVPAAEVYSTSTYSKLSEQFDSYREILEQTSEIVTDNTKVTQEYKDALVELGISEEELAEYFDETDELIVKNADGLNKLVKSTNKNISNNVKLAKSQAKLKYYELYKQMRDFTSGLDYTADGYAILNDNQRLQLDSLYEEMDMIQVAIARFSMLESQLLGVTDAYTKFADAQTADEENEYSTQAESMVETFANALNTGDLGTESARAAMLALVPDEVYKNLDTVKEKMDAIAKYFNEGEMSKYFSIDFDDDGAVEKVDITADDLKQFFEEGKKNGVFTGNWEHFDLSEDITSLEQLAQKMNITEEVAFALFEALENHDAGNLFDPSNILDKFMSGNIEYQAYANAKAMADLQYQLASGTISAEEYAKKMVGLDGQLAAGAITKKEYKNAVAELDKQLEEGTITQQEYNAAVLGLANQQDKITEDAYNNAAAYFEKTAALEECNKKLAEYNELLFDEDGLDANGNVIDKAQVEKDIKAVSQEIALLMDDLDKLEQPTEMIIYLATEHVQDQLGDVKKDIEQLANNDSHVLIQIGAKFQEVEKSGFDLSQFGLSKDNNGNWVGVAEFITSMGLNPDDQETIDTVTNYINLVDAQHTLNLSMGSETASVVDVLTETNKILKSIADKLGVDYTLDVTTDLDTKPVTSFLNTPLSKTISVSIRKVGDWLNGLFANGTVHANGTAHALGTANATGSWGAPKTETALVGELGPELLVRNGRWTTIGDSGAEFAQIRKGDIIFNHKQTEDLLSKGYVTGRGKLHGSALASGTAYDNGIYVYEALKGKESKAYSGSKTSTSSKSASDAADEFREVFDWIAVRLEEINEDIDFKSAKLENAVGYSDQNKIVEDIIKLNEQLYDNLEAGYNKYNAYAQKLLAEVPKAYRDAAKDGSIAIEEFVGKTDEKTLEAIQNYREWAQKAADTAQQAEETITEISNLEKQAIDNIATNYENKSSLRESRIEQLEAYNGLSETTLGAESAKIYQAIIEQNNSIISDLTTQRNKMEAELDKQVDAGYIKKYSQNWYDAVNEIAAVDTEIIELTAELNDLQDAINELHWDSFDFLMDKFDALADEADNLIDILDTKDVVDDDTNWTNEGITQLGLYAQKMEIAEKQAAMYADEIDYLNKNWKKLGYTEQEYVEKLNELKDGQYESIQLYHDSKEAIVDLTSARVDAIKEGIEEEIDAYSELIEKKKEELDAEKDLYDFQKSTMEQEKDIADLRRQLAAIASDNSASARAKRAQLEAELAEAESALEDSYYERSISNRQEALDKELESFQEAKEEEIEGWEKYLENTEQVVSDALTTVQTNTDTVFQTLKAMGNEYDLTMSDALVSPWKDGVIAIQEYAETFGISMSSTMEKLDEMQKKSEELTKTVEEKGKAAVDSVANNFTDYTTVPKAETTTTTTTSKSSTSTSKTETTTKPSLTKGSYVEVKSGTKWYADSYGGGKSGKAKSGKIKYVNTKGSHPYNIDGLGWVRKKDIVGYKTGTTGVKKDQLAWVDEDQLEELVIGVQDGRLTYLTKGSAVVPHDLTTNLMSWGELDPQDMLDRNRPSIAPNKNIVNTEINLDCSVGELVHIDHCDQNTLPDVEKIVNKAFEKHMQNLNNSLKRFVR